MDMTTGKYDELIMSFLRGDCSEEEARFVSLWVAESTENQAYFEAMQRLWKLTDFSQKTIDVESALMCVNRKIDNEVCEVAEEPVRVSWFNRNWKRVSAVAAILVVALTVGLFLRKPVVSPMLTMSSNEWKSDQPFVLPDGSSVTFEEQSQVAYPEAFDDLSRNIMFEGVAIFDIVKDASRPFFIRCGRMEVEVVGTRFRLTAKKDSDQYLLDLFEGCVVMKAKDDAGETADMIRVIPGERGKYLVSENTLKHYSAMELMKENALNDHVLDFNNVSLKTIVKSLEFIYDLHIDLSEECKDYRLTARFTDETVLHVLETIATVYDLELHTIDSTHYTIR